MSERVPKVAGIYAIVYRETGIRYIGQSVDIRNRWRIHRNDLARGVHHSPYLQRMWNKYGSDAFDFVILEAITDIATLTAREQEYLDTRFAAVGSHEFNGSPTAGSPLGVVRSPETRQRWREQRKGRQWSPTRRASYKGPSEAQALQAQKLGHWLKDNIHKPEVYAKHTRITPKRLAHVRKLVELQTGRPHTPEWCANIREGHRRRMERLAAEGKLSMTKTAIKARRLKQRKQEAEARRRLTPDHYQQPPLFDT